MNEIYEFLKKCDTYYLATVEGDQPRVRPFGTIDLFEGGLYILTGMHKSVARQMQQNPKIEISGMVDGEWIRLTATARLDERVEVQAHMLAGYPHLQGAYQPGDGNTAVFRLVDGRAQIQSFNAPAREIRF